MKKVTLFVFLIVIILSAKIYSQTTQDTTMYLITCAPGTETYSIYGHSAIRTIIPAINSDKVYNWGVFDFTTPNFVWKFAKGRLNYYLIETDFQLFIRAYIYENRSVYSQRMNLDSNEKRKLLSLIEKNLEPANRTYRYDFFYDDCSTRIRDIIERSVGTKLIYPPDEQISIKTFRELVGEYQKNYPWLKAGVDLIMGTPGEAKADFRNRMFLPLYLKKNLTQAVINHDRKMVPLLSSTETLLEFPDPVTKSNLYTNPIFLFTLLFIILVFISARFRSGTLIYSIDLVVFTIFALLSVLMIFFNFFTDHQQMKLNMNIIWFNPVIIICLVLLILRKPAKVCFRIVFYLSIVFLPLILIIPGALNNTYVPVILILALRSSARGDFSWNPLSVAE